MKKIYFYFFMLFCTLNIMAQSTANYAFLPNSTGSLALDANANAVDMSTGTTQLVAASLDQGVSAATSIGFNFYLMGTQYTQFSASSNGIMQLGSSAVSTTTYVASGGSTTSPRLSAFGGDLQTGSSGKVHYKLVGTAPNRCLVVEFLNMNLYYKSGVYTNDATFQVRLYETSGIIEYVYGTMTVSVISGSPSDYSPSIGFSVGSGTNLFGSVTYAADTYNTTSTFTENPNSAVGAISQLTSSSDGSRKTYKFTPPSSTTDPTTLTFTAVGSSAITPNWVDNSTNEYAFLVTRATDAAFTAGVVTATVASTTSAATGGAYSLAQTGLSASTLYYYKIQALVEGGASTGLTGSQATNAPGIFTSITTGLWSVGTTWDAGVAPSAVDSAIVSAGNTVTIDATGQAINDLTVNGTLAYGTTPTSFAVNNNLTVASGGLVNVFFTTTGKTLTVKGNIANDGRIDVSVGGTTAGNLTLNGTTVQTVSGAGTFGGTVAATGTTNTAGVIRNLTFSNTSTAIPNIIWSINNVLIAYNLSMTGATVNLGSNKMTFGNYAAANTLTTPVGTGFLPGATFSRWWSNAATGSAIAAGSDTTGTAGRYPFITSLGVQRALCIARSSSSTTGNTAGELVATYTDATTTTTGLSVVDAAYTVTDRYDGKWTITAASGYVYASGTHQLSILANGAIAPANGNTRVMLANATIGGTHQNGTTTPNAQRIALTTAQITAGDIYIGIASSDVPFASVANGNWNAAATWNKGTVPTCTDAVSIAAGTTVTVNSATNNAKNITIAANGTLTVASGDLTVGCTLNNNFITNNGTLTVSGGTLNVNGNISNTATSTFNQSGGDINIDGNAAGVVTSSVASTALFSSTSINVNLSGGTLTFVDPNAATTASTTTGAGLVIFYNYGSNSPNAVATSTSHTTRLGNGTSTDAGGNTNGFYIDSWEGTGHLSFGNLIVTGPAGTNRGATSAYQFTCNGNLDINSGGKLTVATTILGGNLNVNSGGTFISTTGLTTGTVTSSTSSTLTFAPATLAQTITNNGTLSNLATAPTANLTSLSLNSSSTVTLPTNITISGAFSLVGSTVHTVPSGSNYTVGGAVTVPTTASLTFSNNSNLIQGGTTNTNSGSITVKRNSASLMRLDYELWGSPVAAQVLQSFSPATLSNRFYTYDNGTNTYAATAATGTFTNAAGYLIRMPDTHPTTATTFNGSFTGVPNSGNVSITPATGFNAIANPYPSTVNMTTFVTDNPGISGTLYFWRKTNSTIVLPGYCSWNGGTFTSNGQPGATDPASVLQVGQGFIVNSTAGAAIVFKNTQRVANNGDVILKQAAEEKHRVWMNLTSTAGEFSQTAFGYMQNATNGVDALDGKNFNPGSVSLATLVNNTDYVIQGKALPFTDNDLVPMTFKVTNAGNYTIAIDHVDGLFSAGQEVYLRDALTGTETNLTTAGSYTFATTAGTFDTRFTVAYKSSALATNNAAFAASNVVVYKNNGDIVINTGSNMMSSVKVYDVRGRILVDKTNVNASELRVNAGQINQVVLVQVTSAQGEIVTKKVVN